LDRRRSDDRRPEHAEDLGGALGRARADAADDAWQGADLGQEASRRDPLGRMRDEHVLADPEPAAFREVAGDELGSAGRDRRAEQQAVAGPQQRQQVVERRLDLTEVGLDVRERRGPDRDHDVSHPGRVGCAIAQLEHSSRGDALQQLLGALLRERHPAGLESLDDRRVVVDPEYANPAVGEAQGQRQADPPESDHRQRSLVAHRFNATHCPAGNRPPGG
jgi:hypothetical protein